MIIKEGPMAIPDIKLSDIYQAEIHGTNIHLKQGDKDIAIPAAIDCFISLLERDESKLSAADKSKLHAKIIELFSPFLSQKQRNIINKILVLSAVILAPQMLETREAAETTPRSDGLTFGSPVSRPASPAVTPETHSVINLDDYTGEMKKFISFALKHMPREQVVAILELLKVCPEANQKIINKLIQNKSPLLSDRQNIIKFGPLMLWIHNQWKEDPSAARHNRLMLLLDKAIALQLDNPKLAAKLFELPPDKLYLWEHILNQKDCIEDLTEADVREVLTKTGEKALLLMLFEDHKNADALFNRVDNYFKQYHGLGEFDTWIDRLLEATGIDYEGCDLKAKLGKLNERDREIIKSITFIQDQTVLNNVLAFAESVPYPSAVSQYMEGCLEFVKKYGVDERSADYESISRKNREILEASQKLAVKFPHLASRFLMVMKFNPDLLLLFLKLNEKLDDAHFAYFIETYIGNKIDAPKKADPSLSHYAAVVQQMIKNPFALRMAKRTMDIEMKYHIRFNFNFTPIKHPDLLNHLDTHPDFAAHYLKTHFEIINEGTECFDKDPDKMFEIMKIASNYPSICKMLLKKIILEKTSDPLTDLYSQLLILSQNPDNKHIVNRILQSLETNFDGFHWELADLIKNNDLPLLGRLLDMEMHSGHDVVKQMLVYYKQKDNEIAVKMLAMAGSKNINVIRAMMKVLKEGSHPIVAVFLHEPPDSPLLKNLLTLMSRNEGELANRVIELYKEELQTEGLEMIRPSLMPKDTKLNKEILEMIKAGKFTLAKEILKASTEPFHAALLKIPDLTHRQQVRDLQKSISSLPRAKAEEYQGLVDFAIHLSKSPTASKKAAEWMAKVQFLLVHDPKQLDEMCGSTAWKEINAALKKGEEPGELTNKILKEFDLDVATKVQEILEVAAKKSGAAVGQSTPLAIAVARCLLTAGGTLNLGIINIIEARLNSPSVEVNPAAKNYMIMMLRFLQQDYDFSQRLETCQEPPLGSPQRLIIQRLLNLPSADDVTKHTAQLAILSALLWPTRQGKVGSCFATAEVMRMNSSPDGAKQALEDLLSIAANGCIIRKGVKYPLLYDEETFFAMFEGEHFLSRAREYLVATFYEVPSPVKEKLKDHVIALVSQKLASEVLPAGYLTRVKELFTNACRLAYAPKAAGGKIHTWRIMGTVSGKALDADFARLESLTTSVFTQAMAEATQGQSQSAEQMADVERRVAAYVQSTEFWGELIAAIEKGNRTQVGLARVDPSRYGKSAKLTTLLAEPSAGGVSVISGYYSVPVTPLKMVVTRRPVESILHSMRCMSDAQKEAAKSNPALLKSFNTQDHAFNIRIGHIMQTYDEDGLEAYIEGMKKAQMQLMETPVTKEMSELIIAKFTSSFSPFGKARFEKAIATEMEKRGHAINLKDFANLVVNIHCQMTGYHIEKWKSRQHLMSVLKEMPQFQAMLPFLSILDTNWESDLTLETGAFVDPAWEQFAFRSQGKLVEKFNWSPGMAHEWEVPLFDDACDDIARSYCFSEQLAA